MILPLLKDKGLECIGRFYSLYRGMVIDNKDPLKLNRLKIHVPDIGSNYELDWAFPRNQSGNMISGFKYLTPKVGSIVWVEFKNGDPLYPIWSYHGWAIGEVPKELQDTDTMGIVTPSNHKIYLKDVEGILHLSISNGKEDIFTLEINKDTLNISGKAINLLEAKYGIPLSDKITEKLNTLESSINTLKDLISQSAANVKPNDGGASAFAILSQFSSQKLDKTLISDIENPNIKQ